MRKLFALALGLAALTGCPPADAPKAKTVEDFGPPSSGDAMPPARALDPNDKKPEVTKDVGHKGGMIVLWPRVVPADAPKAHDLAAKAQQRLQMLAHRVGGARNVEVRPEPEVVCPSYGCTAMMIGALIVVEGDKCAVMAYAAGVDKSPAHLLPWAGKLDTSGDIFPFRESPEPLVKGKKELVPCEELLKGRENQEAAIARYIYGLLPGK